MGGEAVEEYQPGESNSRAGKYPLYHRTYENGTAEIYSFSQKADGQATGQQRGSYLGAVKLEIKYRGMTTKLFVPGLARMTGTPVTGTMGDLSYTITYGSQENPCALFTLFEGF